MADLGEVGVVGDLGDDVTVGDGLLTLAPEREPLDLGLIAIGVYAPW